MSSGEKKIAVVLVVVLIAMVGAYFALGSRMDAAQMPGPPGMAGAGGAGGAACPAPGADGSVPTQEFGKAGAKVEVIALLPITHGCHVNTEAELKKVQQKHPDDVHLVIVDLFGPEAEQYQQQIGGGRRTVVAVNGKTSFDLKGRRITLEMIEGMSYRPADIGPVIEEAIKNAS
jgi:hypothetical protein